ncbi:MAG: hypothetical protein H7Y22_08460 [Gemmatimonadaceae bacterium]|nr:hypothetical protein [Gloeobacterales cyanobacterium ES-bin-141]
MQFLLIARIPHGVSIEEVRPYVKAEAQAVWQKYAAEVVRSIHYIADMSGAVLTCEAPDLPTMQMIASQLPMVDAGVLQVEVIPLKPYTGFASLFEPSS